MTEAALQELQGRQEGERVALQAQCDQLLADAGSDRKKKKKAKDKITVLQHELSTRHDNERYNLLNEAGAAGEDSDSDADQDEPTPPTPTQTEPQGKKKKKNRQKERLARREAAEAAMRAEVAAELAGTVSKKEVEETAFKRLLTDANKRLHDIKPDGHCLYNALAHQLVTRSKERFSQMISHEDMRKQLGAYMRSNKDLFEPFIAMDGGDDAPDFDTYVERLETTAYWGGQVELMGLSQLYKVPIVVIQAEGSPQTFGEDLMTENPDSACYVSYHRHSYGLGEHYNSVVDSPQAV